MCRKYLENETEEIFYSGAQLLSPYNNKREKIEEN